MDLINIHSENYNGKTAIVTFYPISGGAVNLGSKQIPFDVTLDNPYGTYSMFFGEYGNTCTLYVLPTTTTSTTVL